MNALLTATHGAALPPLEPANAESRPETLEQARELRHALSREVQAIQAQIALELEPERRRILIATREERATEIQAVRAWIRERCVAGDWALLAAAYKMLVPGAATPAQDVNDLLDAIELRVGREALGVAYEARRDAEAELASGWWPGATTAAPEVVQAHRDIKPENVLLLVAGAHAALNRIVGGLGIFVPDVDRVLEAIEAAIPMPLLDAAEKALDERSAARGAEQGGA